MSLADRTPAKKGVRIVDPDAKILTIDIERLPGKAWAFDQKTQFISYRNFIEDPRTTTMAWRWYGQRKVEFAAEWDDGGHEAFIRKTWDLFNEADVIQSYNGVRFDNPVLKGDWLTYGLKPPRPWKDVDLYAVMRQFGFLSKSLDYTTRKLGRPGKQLHYSIELMEAAIAGDPKARKKIKRYNCGDVELAEWLGDYLRPWIKNHPFPRSMGDEKQCNHCGSSDLRLDETKYRAVVLEYALYQCRNCHGWVRGGWEARAANTRGV